MAYKKAIHLPRWLAAGILAFALSVMGIIVVVQKTKPGKEMKTFLETSQQQSANIGAHRQSDPHVNLGPQKMAQVALQHLDESRSQLALETLNSAIKKYPKDSMLLSIRASLFLQNQQTSPALADLNQAINLNPHDPVLLTNRAQALRQFGRNDDARHDLDQAIKLDPEFVAAHFNRGSLYYESEKFGLALEDFNRCIDLKPEIPAAYFNRASTFKALGDRRRAIDDLQHFLTLGPEASWVKIAKDMLKQWNADLS